MENETSARPADSTIHYVDHIGKVGLGVDRETHEILVMLKTPMGTLSETLTKEQALRLGIELVRLSGQTFRFAPAPERNPDNAIVPAGPPPAHGTCLAPGSVEPAHITAPNGATE